MASGDGRLTVTERGDLERAPPCGRSPLLARVTLRFRSFRRRSRREVPAVRHQRESGRQQVLQRLRRAARSGVPLVRDSERRRQEVLRPVRGRARTRPSCRGRGASEPAPHRTGGRRPGQSGLDCSQCDGRAPSGDRHVLRPGRFDRAVAAARSRRPPRSDAALPRDELPGDQRLRRSHRPDAGRWAVMLTGDGVAQSVSLLDFGIATHQEEGRSSAVETSVADGVAALDGAGALS